MGRLQCFKTLLSSRTKRREKNIRRTWPHFVDSDREKKLSYLKVGKHWTVPYCESQLFAYGKSVCTKKCTIASLLLRVPTSMWLIWIMLSQNRQVGKQRKYDNCDLSWEWINQETTLFLFLNN